MEPAPAADLPPLSPRDRIGMKQSSQGLGEAVLGLGLLRWIGGRAARARTAVRTEPVTAGVRGLSRLAPGEGDIVQRVGGSGPVRQRLLELGVTPGARVDVIRFAPLGDPIEVRVRGYHLSLRRREAEAIWVGREDPERDGDDAPVAEPCGAGGQSQQR
jgi:ferrous iron transport protein A